MFRPRLAPRSPLSCHPERREGSVFHIFLPPAPHSAPARKIRRRELLPLPPVTNHQSPITKSFTIRTYKKTGGGSPLPPLEVYNSLLRTNAPTRHAGALASPILSCISAHFPSHRGVGVRAHFQPQVQLRIRESAPA